MSSVPTIADHQQRATTKLLEQSKNRPNFNSLLNAMTAVVQSFEDLSYPVLGGRSLATAVGLQLDHLGEIVGLGRNGLDDPTYKLYLIGTIAKNNSDSTTATLLNIVQALFEAKTANIISPLTGGHDHRRAPAVIGIEVGSPTVDPSLYATAISILKDALAATVRIMFVRTYTVGSSLGLKGSVTGQGLGAGGFPTLIYSDSGA
jgi:hypothetical protein